MWAYYDCDGGFMNFWERGLSQNTNNTTQSNPKHPQEQSKPSSNNMDMMGQIARLNKLSETERMGELMRTAGKMRADGTLNGGDLERIYQTASMFMTEDQLQKLRALIDMVK